MEKLKQAQVEIAPSVLMLTVTDAKGNLPSYVKKLTEFIASGAVKVTPGLMREIDVVHEDWCKALGDGGFCQCNCEIRLRK